MTAPRPWRPPADTDRWVSAFYLPGGDFAAALGAAHGVRAKLGVCGAFAGRLRFTPLYLATIVGLALVLNHGVSKATRARVIQANSTNVHNLHHHRIWTLVTSAFLTDGRLRLPSLAGLALLLGAAELLWGWRRLVTVFFLGNAVASCLVYGLLRAGVHNGWLGRAVTVASDVGFSYGTHAVSGAIIFSLPLRGRRFLVPLALLAVVVPLIVGHTFTDLGHLLATLVGFAVGWQLRRRPLAARLRGGPTHRHPVTTVYRFDELSQARAGTVTALHLQEHHHIGLVDYALTWRDSASRVRVREGRDMRGIDGAVAGAAAGTVAATLIGAPLTGALAGMVVGAVAAILHDSGLPDARIDAAAAGLPPGHAALLLQLNPADRAVVDAALAQLGAVAEPAGSESGPAGGSADWRQVQPPVP